MTTSPLAPATCALATRVPAPFKGALLALGFAMIATPETASADDAPLPEYRLSLRGQVAHVTDERASGLSASRVWGGVELGADLFFGERLFAGLIYAGRSMGGSIYEVGQAALTGNALRVAVGWRFRPFNALQVYGRAGVAAWWFDLKYEDEYGDGDGEVDVAAESEAVEPGFFAGVGVDWFFLAPRGKPAATRGQRFSIGANFELTYDRILPLAFADDGRSLGALDASGPGFLTGLLMQF